MTTRRKSPQIKAPTHRAQQLSLLVAGVYVVLVGRLYYLQVYKHNMYARHAAQRVKVIPVVAERGSVMDKNGALLAQTVYAHHVVADMVLITDEEKLESGPRGTGEPVLRERAAASLGNLAGVSSTEILTRLATANSSKQGHPRRVVILSDISDTLANTLKEIKSGEEIKRINEDLAEARRARKQAKSTRETEAANQEISRLQQNLKEARSITKSLVGIFVEDEPRRAYPMGRASVHLVGMINKEDEGKLTGKLGIEQTQDSELRGLNGKRQVELTGGLIFPMSSRVIEPSEDGTNVKLTIDSYVQRVTDQHLSEAYVKTRAAGAAAFVIDIQTGDLLSLASAPNFDPVTRSEITADAIRDRERSPLLNRGLRSYEPGSTFKPITAAAGLEFGTIHAGQTWSCNGKLQVGNKFIKCSLHGKDEVHGHGTRDLDGVLLKSCNVATAAIGMDLGMERLMTVVDKFGLREPTGVGLRPDPAGTLGAETTGKGKVARVAFGHSIMVNPLALGYAYAAIANEGVAMKPRLVWQLIGPDGKVIKENRPEQRGRVISAKTARTLMQAMRKTVQEGTGKAAAVAGFSAAGKTGTAQKVVPGQAGYASGKYISSFFGYFPANNPKVVIGVLIDEPEGDHYGGKVAAPVFKAIAQDLVGNLGLAPDEPEKLPARPNVVKR